MPPNSTPNMYSPTTERRERLFPTEIPASLHSWPRNYVAFLTLNKTSVPPITHRQMDSQNARTSGWNSTCASTPTISRQTGQHGCHWHSMSITPGPAPRRRKHHSISSWGTRQDYTCPRPPHTYLMARTTALTAIKNAQQMLLKHALRKKGQHHFHPLVAGQKVWLEGTNLKTSHPTKKFAPKHYSPFSITDVISPVIYRLTLPPSWKIHNVFHVSLLTLYKEMEEHRPNFAEPPPELIEEQEKYEVEQVLASRLYGH
jgi:hypothetical protein